MRKLLLLSALTGFATEHAQAAQPAADVELLEFLGSLDNEEDGWQEFLEQMPVKSPTKVAGTVSEKPPTRTPPSSRTPDAKQVKTK